MKQSRWTSPVLWAGLASQAVNILVLTGTIDVVTGNKIDGIAKAIIALVMTAITGISVANNPTDKEGF